MHAISQPRRGTRVLNPVCVVRPALDTEQTPQQQGQVDLRRVRPGKSVW